MPNPENIAPHNFEKGKSGNPNGRPRGVKNRSTIVKNILSVITKIPQAQFEQLKELYPDIQDKMSVEEMMTLIQANKAITKEDTNAYKALMDSGYGAPQVDITTDGQPMVNNLSVEIIKPLNYDDED